MASPPPPGIYVPVPTFFRKASANELTQPLDLDTQFKHALHLAKNGIKGLVLLGSTGEAIAMTEEERKTLISHIRQGFDGVGYQGYPLIAGTATQSIEDTLRQLHISKEAGAQWGLVLAPGFFATCITQQGIVDWYTVIADRSPMPILMYVIATPHKTSLPPSHHYHRNIFNQDLHTTPKANTRPDTTTPPSPIPSPSPPPPSPIFPPTPTSPVQNSPTATSPFTPSSLPPLCPPCPPHTSQPSRAWDNNSSPS
ncbi:MAG: hypothetical protein Q9216_001219 [Gyalolechia sp. 2 TL-2023]